MLETRKLQSSYRTSRSDFWRHQGNPK